MNGEAAPPDGERIEQLLTELERTAGPTTWPRVEELVRRLVGLSGEGLARLLAHARAAGADEAALRDRLDTDDVLGGLLLLHGLHPRPLEERVERALDRARTYLGAHAGGVELVGIDPHGVARLRLLGTCDGCPSSLSTVETTLRTALLEAAPEIVDLHVEGAAHRLPVLGAQRRSPRWVAAADLESLPPAGRRLLQIENRAILVLRAGDRLLAFENACGACARRLDAALLDGTRLTCAACEAEFDLAAAGRAVHGGAWLSPVPLVIDEGGPQLAVEA